MRRIVYLFVFALVVSGTASASSITFTEIAGSFTINQANWNGSTIAVSGRYANGSPFVFQNGLFTNLQAPSGALTFAGAGAVGDFFLGTAVLQDSSLEGMVYSSTGSILNSYSLGFATAANNSQFAGTNNSGQAVFGYIDSTGHVTSMQTVTKQGAEDHLDANGVNGGTVAGLTSVNGGSLKAFLSINGVRQTLDVGLSSFAQGVDASTNLPFGERNGKAVWWDASGSYHEIPNVSGSGTIAGYVTSAFGGLFTIKDSQGNLWISDGSTTKSFFAYTSALGVSTGSIPADAFFVGNGAQSALVFEGSIAYAMGNTTDFRAGLGATNTPEPGSLILIATGLTILFFVPHRRRAV